MARGMGCVRATADTVARTHPIPQAIHLYRAALPRRGAEELARGRVASRVLIDGKVEFRRPPAA